MCSPLISLHCAFISIGISPCSRTIGIGVVIVVNCLSCGHKNEVVIDLLRGRWHNTQKEMFYCFISGAVMSKMTTSKHVSTKVFACPRLEQTVSIAVESITTVTKTGTTRAPRIRSATKHEITNCTGLDSCGIKEETGDTVTVVWKECPFFQSLHPE